MNMPFCITQEEFNKSKRYMKIFTYDKNNKIYCKYCNKKINASYYDKHTKTNKHLLNIRKMSCNNKN